MNLRENILLALQSIRSNLVRTVLTCLIIAFGIMALVGILTAIDSLEGSIKSNFSSLGANSISIEQKRDYGRRGGGNNDKPGPPILYREAVLFKERYAFPAVVSISDNVTGISTIKHDSKKTNPNVLVTGVDENFLITSGNEVGNGRYFTLDEIQEGAPMIVLGQDVSPHGDPDGTYWEWHVLVLSDGRWQGARSGRDNGRTDAERRQHGRSSGRQAAWGLSGGEVR